MTNRTTLWVALSTLLVAFVVGGLCQPLGAQPDADKGEVLVIYAQKTDKLSARLRAIQLAREAKVLAKATNNALVVEVPKDKVAAVVDRLSAADARCTKTRPARETPVEDLMLSYKKAPTKAELKKMGLKLVKEHKHEDGVVLLVRPLKPLDAALVDRLEKEADLTHAETNQTMRLPDPVPGIAQEETIAAASPNDPHFAQLWGLRNIQAPTAWKKGSKSPKIIVAVIDTGVDPNHEDLKGKLVKGLNAIDPSQKPLDDNGHGTHVAGTIGAIGDNGKGVTGVTWDVRIMPLKFLNKAGSGSVMDAIECIDFARVNGAHIMNNSWGGGSFSQALFDAIRRANARGILFVAAAGNNAQDNDINPFYPASYNQPNVLSVAAIDIANSKAGFSHVGRKSVHLAAPGVGILSTVPKAGQISSPKGYLAISGTSMATPHVSGAAALALSRSAYAGFKADKLKALLMKNARKIPAMNGKCVTGGTLDIAFLGK